MYYILYIHIIYIHIYVCTCYIYTYIHPQFQNSSRHLDRTNSLVPSKLPIKLLCKNPCHSNSHNSKNHLMRTVCYASLAIFSHVIRNLGKNITTASFFLK